MISLNQTSYLLEVLDKDHFGIYDRESLWEQLGKLTEPRYKYLLALVFNKKYFEAKKLIDKLGVKKI